MALHEILTDAELAQLCHNENRDLINPRIVKISNEAVIKFGQIRPEEAENLRIARAILDPTIIRVPEFYRFFIQRSESYLVMEYIEGRIPSESEYHVLAEQMNNVLRYFRSLFSLNGRPGSLDGGISRGHFWKSDYPNFQTAEQLENWINKRVPISFKISFQNCDLVFSHLDLAPRNIIKKDDGTLYLVDWEAAGYYPKCFELAAIQMTNKYTTNFESILLEMIRKDLGARESTNAHCVMEAWYKSDCTFFKPTPISNRPQQLDIKAFITRYGTESSKSLGPAPPVPSGISCVH
ncbi:hypothetical protein EYR41_006079 [Orbilia oligospora]|uniref:Aminoglycoside phosphotransferase domain-containing protein n=1 Tax=Orbilia oligospora TaxID=2813651 RepID=A0A8H2E0D9_ORBOL|nr:hypothetical protein EYR41_006079 [Orbilia oligospora]